MRRDHREPDTCVAIAVGGLIPSITPDEKKKLEVDTQDYDECIVKINEVVKGHGMVFRPTKPTSKRRGKLLLFGTLNSSLFNESPEGDWSHCVSVDFATNAIFCSCMNGVPTDERIAYGADGWISKHDYLTQISHAFLLKPLPGAKCLDAYPPATALKRARRETEGGVDDSRKRSCNSKRVSDHSTKKRISIPNVAPGAATPEQKESPEFIYDADAVSGRSTKKKANLLFAASLSKHCGKMNPGTVAYLEAQDGNTTSHIPSAIKKRHQLLAINFDPQVIADLALCKIPACLLTASVQEWSRKVAEESVVGCWLDYCSTLHGNDKNNSSPFNDICRLVYRRAFREGGVVAITICTRDSKTSDSSRNFPRKIRGMFKGNYPKAEIEDVFSYTGMMYVSLRV